MIKIFFRLFSISPPFPQTQKLILGKLKNMKTLIHLSPAVLLFILLFLDPALAGSPPLKWQKNFGGSNTEYGESIQQTTDGGYIITGYTDSYGAGSWDIYLIKTDPNGSFQWQKTFGGTDEERAYSVQQTSDGGYIIVGYTASYGAGRIDVFLVKTDPNGDSQWQKTFGGTSSDWGKSVQQTFDGGYIIAGTTHSFDPPSLYVYLVKTDPNGDSQWQKTFSGSFGNSVQQTSDFGYIIAGVSNSDVYLVKTDPNGKMQWQNRYGGSETDWGYSVQQASDGGYIVAGYRSSYFSGANIYLIKTNPNLTLQWQKSFGGSDYDEGHSVQQTSDGGYIVAGRSWSYSSGNFSCVYIVKTDPNGNSQWQKTLAFGANTYEEYQSVQQTTDGGYVIAGPTWSSSSGSMDVYLVKLCPDGTLSADFNCDGTVYYEDLEVLVAQWLQPPDILSADIFPELGDGIVNGFDFAALANDWLQTTSP
ncbi:MAG: hypothetical protein ACYS67_09710 [Planctomycetota bacterium]